MGGGELWVVAMGMAVGVGVGVGKLLAWCVCRVSVEYLLYCTTEYYGIVPVPPP